MPLRHDWPHIHRYIYIFYQYNTTLLRNLHSSHRFIVWINYKCHSYCQRCQPLPALPTLHTYIQYEDEKNFMINVLFTNLRTLKLYAISLFTLFWYESGKIKIIQSPEWKSNPQPSRLQSHACATAPQRPTYIISSNKDNNQKIKNMAMVLTHGRVSRYFLIDS